VARIGQLFGGRTHGTVDRDGDGVDDRTETPERTKRIPAAGVLDRDTDQDGIADHRGTTTTTTLRPGTDRDAPQPPAPPVRHAPARASLMATFGMILGVAGVAVALTGLLAPWAIAVGAVGLLLSLGGVIAGARPNVAGRGLGVLGVLFSGTAIVLGILAITGQVSWLDSDVDQVARLNDWLDTQLPWMKDW
jgi:hypothetical protein